MNSFFVFFLPSGQRTNEEHTKNWSVPGFSFALVVKPSHQETFMLLFFISFLFLICSHTVFYVFRSVSFHKNPCIFIYYYSGIKDIKEIKNKSSTALFWVQEILLFLSLHSYESKHYIQWKNVEKDHCLSK